MKKTFLFLTTALMLFAFRVPVKNNPATSAAPFETNKVLIVLQENTGKLNVLPDNTPKEFKSFFSAAVDRIAETFEDIKSELQGSTRYKKVIFLTDVNCTKAKLLANLIQETVNGNEIDLFCFGHGSQELLVLHDETLTGGTTGTIRKLLTDARAQKGSKFDFNLRLVYMCECIGSTVNDDWRAIGARVSVGSKCLNFMAEPMITLFIHKYLLENKTVATSASESFNEAKAVWQAANAVVPQLGYSTPPAGFGCAPGEDKYETSRPLIAGDGNVQFNPNAQNLGSAFTNISFRTIGNLTGTTADDDLQEGTYYIVNGASSTNKYLDVSGSCLDESICKVQLYDMGQSPSNNQWVVKKIDGILGGYTLKCVANNKYLDADLNPHDPQENILDVTFNLTPNVFFNGCKINTAPRTSSLLPRTNQEWKIVYRGNGKYSIKCIMSGLYLDAVNNCVDQNGCKVQLWEDYSQATQKWKFVKAN